MNILLIHNSYQQPGGEDRVFEMEAALLRSRHHNVHLFHAHNSDVSNKGSIALFAQTLWNRQIHTKLRRTIRENEIELVHLHNTFPVISPAAYYAAAAERVPVVQTLHNYRLLCPAATLYREQKLCEDCVGKLVTLPAIRHSCYRESKTASFASTAMLAVHRAAGTWTRRVSRYIALTDFARSKFIEGGLPAGRISVKPNFLDPDPGPSSAEGRYALFIGRLTPEKGLRTLLKAWSVLQGVMPLQILGMGPMEDEVQSAAAQLRNVECHGWLTREQLLDKIRGAAVVIVPSEWYEPFGLTIVEAFASGIPVIASRLGSLDSLVEHRRTGLVFEPGNPDDLASQVRWLAGNPDAARAMRAQARLEFENKYTAQKNYELLMSIYHGVLQDAKPLTKRHDGRVETVREESCAEWVCEAKLPK